MDQQFEVYNFKNPRPLTEKEIVILRTTSERFAKLASVNLSMQLGVDVQIEVDPKMVQKSFREFFDQIEVPSLCAVIDFDPLYEQLILRIEPTVSTTISLLLFGGHVESSKEVSHELTEIESSIMEGILVRLLGNLRESWSLLLAARPRLCYVENNPSAIQELPKESFWLQIHFEVNIGEVEGKMSLYFPHSFFDSMAEEISNSIPKDTTSILNRKILENLMIEKYESLHLTTVSFDEILHLKDGDTILCNAKEKRRLYKTVCDHKEKSKL